MKSMQLVLCLLLTEPSRSEEILSAGVDQITASIIESTQQTRLSTKGQVVEPSNQPASETLPNKPSAQGDEPIKLVVTDEKYGYRVPDAFTATKTDTPIRDRYSRKIN